MDLRSIDISTFTSVDKPKEFGPVPDQRWLSIERLMVDPSYQREIAGSGRQNIRRIAEGFSWCKFSPVICAPIAGGRYAIIDGQHRTTAALLLGFTEVPCQVVVASRSEQAEAFTAINGNTTAVSGLAVFHARVTAGDASAAALLAACQECNVTILRGVPSMRSIKPGQTMAVRALEGIQARHGLDVLRATLSAIMQGSNGEEPGVLRAGIVHPLAEVLADHADWRGDTLEGAVDSLDLDDMFRRSQIEAHRSAGLTGRVLMEAKLVDALEKAFR